MKITHRKINASTQPYSVYMIMQSDANGSHCLAKFFAEDDTDANLQLAEQRELHPTLADGVFVVPYDETLDTFNHSNLLDHSNNEVYNNLAVIFDQWASNLSSYEDYMGGDDLPFSSTNITSDTILADKPADSLRAQVYKAAEQVMMSPDFGFTAEEAKQYLYVDAYYSEDQDGTIVELRAEVSYEGLCKLCEACNNVVAQYDEDAYFEPVTPGIAEAVVRDTNTSVTSASYSYGGAYDVEDDMFFTKEELTEWASELIDTFNQTNNSNYHLDDLYMKDTTTGQISISDSDYVLMADIVIDMRKIKKPSDITKYSSNILAQWQKEYDEYVATTIESADIIRYDEDEPMSTESYNEYDLWGDTPDDWYNSEEYPDIDSYVPDFTDTLPLHISDEVVIVKDNGDLEFESYDWALEVDASCSEYPDLELDDGYEIGDTALELLEPNIPAEPGKYLVSANVTLVYDVSGVKDLNDRNIPPYVDDAKCIVNYALSEATDVEVKPL